MRATVVTVLIAMAVVLTVVAATPLTDTETRRAGRAADTAPPAASEDLLSVFRTGWRSCDWSELRCPVAGSEFF